MSASGAAAEFPNHFDRLAAGPSPDSGGGQLWPLKLTIAELYAVATEAEAAVLDALRERAGHTWRCKCGVRNLASADECEVCGHAAAKGEA